MEDRIRQAVRERYGRLAAGRGCGCGCEAPQGAAVPGAVGPSLGCGSPLLHADLQPGEAVLDVGSGAGLEVLRAASLVRPLGRAVGVDATPEMVALANQNAAALGVSNARFLLGDAEALPVPDACVDVVLSNCTINLVPDKLRVFREAHRVLRPGGRLVFADVVTDGPVPPELREDPEAWSACVSGALSLEEYLGMLRDSGFDPVEVLDVSEACWGSTWGVPLRSVTVRAHKPR